MLPPIDLPNNYNYIGAFLALGCNLTCSYCINHQSGELRRRKMMSAQEWIDGLNRLNLGPDLPITFQGGEPTLHRGFIDIINRVDSKKNIDILTNLQFDLQKFADRVPPSRLKRDSKYASIRASFHPETMDEQDTLERALFLQEKGYSIGVYGVLHPSQKEQVLKAQELFLKEGIDFRTKEFIGVYNNELYGQFSYKGACASRKTMSCECKTSELLIGSNGDIYRCHHDLYNNIFPIGNLLDEDLQIKDIFRECHYFGRCNPCDIKVKTNRHQQFGHTSVEIRNIRAQPQEIK